MFSQLCKYTKSPFELFEFGLSIQNNNCLTDGEVPENIFVDIIPSFTPMTLVNSQIVMFRIGSIYIICSHHPLGVCYNSRLFVFRSATLEFFRSATLEFLGVYA